MFISSANVKDTVKTVIMFSSARIATKTLVRASGRTYTTLASIWFVLCAFLFFNNRRHVQLTARQLLLRSADQACALLASVLLGVGAAKY